MEEEGEEGQDDGKRQLTRSENEAIARHRTVAPWMYIALHLLKKRWSAPSPVPLAPSQVPSLAHISALLRSWAVPADSAAVEHWPSRDVKELSNSQPSPAHFAALWEHPGEIVQSAVLGTHRFLMPPRSAFALAHAPHLEMLAGRRFRLVLADPPWENASARRAGLYDSLAPHQLRAMAVAPLLAARAYVAVWVTNKEPLVRFVSKSLLPAWGAKHVATAYWLKVTCEALPVCPIDPPHPTAGGAPHRPYEQLIIGRAGEASPELEQLEARLLQSRVLVSDAGQRHSRKPPLDQLFEPLLKAEEEKSINVTTPARLELFAREMRSGWTAWGNEVLLFQEKEGNFGS